MGYSAGPNVITTVFNSVEEAEVLAQERGNDRHRGQYDVRRAGLHLPC